MLMKKEKSNEDDQSAPYERLLAINGITVENIIETAKGLVK